MDSLDVYDPYMNIGPGPSGRSGYVCDACMADDSRECIGPSCTEFEVVSLEFVPLDARLLDKEESHA